MRRSLALIILLAASPASANCTATRVGDYTFYNCSDGRGGSSTTIGDFTFYHGNDGSSGSSTRIGEFEFYNGATPPRSDRPGWEPIRPRQPYAPYDTRSWEQEE